MARTALHDPADAAPVRPVPASNPPAVKGLACASHRPAVWVIETREFGVWETRAEAVSDISAFRVASRLAKRHGEHNVRISTPDNEIL